MKLFKTGIIALMLCAVSAFSAFAAQGTISFSDPQVSVGDEVNVSMKITADEGTALSSANVVLTYPTDGLEFVSGTDADGGAGAVRVHGASNGSGTAQLEYNLKFKTSAAGSFNIGIDSYEVYDSNDQPIEFTHLGSSAVTVSAAQGASSNTALGSLDVYPGTLEPAFSADNTTYSLTVGLGVSKLTVNAIPADPSSVVSTSGNDALPEGDSSVVITVNAADGSSSQQYTINVSKVEGGPEDTGEGAQNVEGIKLSSKGKTIIVMNPPADADVPEGLKEGTITIDGQKVQGWVWGASENPEYCVVYGMTADSSKSGDEDRYGNIGFYRYDMTEKTIQRYFEDPIASGAVSSAEYGDLETKYTAAQRSAETRLIIIVALAVIAFAAVMVSVYMSVRFKSNEKAQRAYRRKSLDRFRAEDDSDMKIADKSDKASIVANSTVESASGEMGDVKELLKHDFSADDSSDTESNAADETQVIRRPERKRRPRRVIRAERIEDENTDEIATLSDSDEQPEDNNVQLSEGSEAVSEADESNDTADNNS